MGKILQIVPAPPGWRIVRANVWRKTPEESPVVLGDLALFGLCKGEKGEAPYVEVLLTTDVPQYFEVSEYDKNYLGIIGPTDDVTDWFEAANDRIIESQEQGS